MQNKKKKGGDGDDDEGRPYRGEWGFQQRAHQRESHLQKGGGSLTLLACRSIVIVRSPRRNSPQVERRMGGPPPPVLFLPRLRGPVQRGQPLQLWVDSDDHIQDRGGQEGRGISSKPQVAILGRRIREQVERGERRGGGRAREEE